MSTEVLLMSDVANLGKAGDVVKVADGYARNYLLPQELAAPVTKASLRRLEKLRKEREELARIQKAEATAKAAKKTARKTTAGRKVPPKYRNPANPAETWTGRGKHPRWLAAQLAKGKKLEDFLIKKK